MKKKDLGKIHINTGDGKGKTTAAIGLSVRAAGFGLKVYIVQFMKGWDTTERSVIKDIKKIQLKHFGPGPFVIKTAKNIDKIEAEKALEWSQKVLYSGKYDLVILDEIFLAVFFKLIPVSAVVNLIKNKPENVELVLTGRKCPKSIYRYADYVTEFTEIKHPYQKGILARKGIEY